MKRADLIQQLEKMGCVLIRHGANHDWYHNPGTRMSQPVLVDRGIQDHLARHIIRILADER